MVARVVQEFRGFSGSTVVLMGKRGNLFVRKTGNIQRNVEQIEALKHRYPVPKIYTVRGDTVDMEYLHGLDIRSYLISNSTTKLLNFIVDTFEKMSSRVVIKDYTDTYKRFLETVDFSNFSFDATDLLKHIPTHLPQSEYHGDFTLENVIYHNDSFVLIDCSTSVWDSFIFDIAKMRQDLECKWFLRNSPAMIENKLQTIQSKLFSLWPVTNNDYLLILMLLRVYRYTYNNSPERDLIQREIQRLWK